MLLSWQSREASLFLGDDFSIDLYPLASLDWTIQRNGHSLAEFLSWGLQWTRLSKPSYKKNFSYKVSKRTYERNFAKTLFRVCKW